MAIGDRNRTATPPLSRRRLIASIAGVAALATVVAVAVTAQGYESQEVPRLESSVWVLRDSGQYARVNTELAEIDTVRNVDAPDAVWQSGADAVLYSQGSRQRWDLDAAAPQNLLSDSGEEGTASASEPTPAGTREIVSAGPYVAYRSDTGQVSVSTLSAGAATAVVDPFSDVEVEEGEDPPTYTADAIGLSPDGILALYSGDEGAVRRFDIDEYAFLGDAQAIDSAPDAGTDVAMTVVGDRWALLQPGDGRLWTGGGEPQTLDIADDAVLQAGSVEAENLLIADSDGLVSVPLAGGEATRTVEASGVPAVPAFAGGEAYAAWLDTGAGTLWADGKSVDLTMPDKALESGSIRPVFRSNGDRAVLSEVGTGLIWTAPEGRLIPLDQWAVEKETEQEEGTVVVEDIAEQMPPVAVDDAFGVRSGQQVILPVLYNDHDPNRKDVLSVDAASLGGLSNPDFGDLSLVANGQSLVVTVRAGSGQASFSYSVTDGSAVSEPATVTLTVVDPASNSAPVWCGVEACQQEWPTPQLLPGGSTIVAALSGWVDPEGDPFVLSDAYETDAAAPVMVVPMDDGRVAIRHTDPNAADAVISVTVVVQDAQGATAEKVLDVQVTANPALVAAPVALNALVGEPQSIEVADHLSGGSGSYRLLDAVQTSASADGLEVAPNTAAGTVELTVAQPGQYVVTYTAQDAVTQAERSAVIRVTAVDGSTALAMAPLTAFVREGQDTTVDVLRGVQNNTGRVLLVSGAESSTSRLNVGVVGNESIRVSGTTADGEPGVIGSASVTIADGAGGAVKGTVTVFLTSPSTVTRPIVFADAITVRAGSLSRIAVTANDVAPRGEPLLVLPEVTGSDQPDELVFADGNALRYLAPKTPGTYRLTYSVALERNPSLSDNGTVLVTVVPSGTNRAPTPITLEGRVLSGQTVSLTVPPTGMDADGDRVSLAGVAQPGSGKGTVTISPSGDAIVYRAPAGGVRDGQVSFDYTVRDTQGDQGTGTVRIGVLDAAIDDTAPVTFSDYVRVRVDSSTPVVLDPRANDIDPAQGELELVELIPNAPTAPGNPLYARLDRLIDDQTSLDDGRVVLQAGDVAGTNSYIYTVQSTRTGSTSQGLIVVTVTEDDVADQPTVADTVLTARDRAELSSGGIDVVTDRVQWTSGDVGALTLSLWGDQPGFSVSGDRITGQAPPEGALVPFTLSGTVGGRDIVGHGFLHIPAFDDLRVQTLPGAEPVVVDEEATAQFDVSDYVDLSSSDPFDVGTDLSAQRASAICSATGKTGTYQSGTGAPWSDTCLVPVRLKGQQSWSYIEVPISIRPAAPQVNLAPIAQTIAPGAAATIDIYSGMVSWEGGRSGDASTLQYGIDYSGSAFTVTRDGAALTIEARADAQPGTREEIAVSVAEYGGASSAIRLVVGIAPPDAPRGATFTQQCIVTTPGCSVEAVGIAGEYDPFQGKVGAGLTLTSIGAGARCDVASVTVAGNSLAVSWPGGGNAPGGQCIIPFVVSDAQGRTGTGTMTLDLQGISQPPASVTTAAYTRTTVTLDVPLGEAARAHPAVTGVTILRDGAPANAACTPNAGFYRCTVSGLVNGEPHAYTAVAVNAVGSSTPTSAHTTWAYAAPEISGAAAAPVYRAGVTTTSQGVASLSITAGDDAASFRIENSGQVIPRSGATTTVDVTLPPGAQTITIVPISQFQPPTGGGNEGGAFQASVTVAGAPIIGSGTAAAASSNSSIAVSGPTSANGNGSARPITMKYLAWRSGTATCTANPDGTLSANAEVMSDTPTLSGLEAYSTYNVKVCASNGYGVAESSPASVFVFQSIGGPGGDLTWAVSNTYAQSGNRYSYGLAKAPTVEAQPNFSPQFRVYGSWEGGFSLSPNSAPSNAKARTCHQTFTWACSPEVALTPASGSAPTMVTVDFAQCVPAQPQNVATISTAANGSATITAKPLQTDPLQPARYEVALTWKGAFATLQPITRTMDACPVP
ncbi:hypothetical protein DXT68_02445 [Microbacterium foliorum]|uniref:Fibronectin type III domain-containing protein n=1 Tax=Microbacterium foliorum TaxID=104336 RepID=A0A0F0KFZ4_9MICO|nr:Ig-like domain-containing protein [Microbacterium foliorum]AXL11120.1 hypothetical protein DXT68_02445 [Microbacterium foliorum]KJL19354.1 hypothetical protein RN50_02639 [Microbacterium foliorum]